MVLPESKGSVKVEVTLNPDHLNGGDQYRKEENYSPVIFDKKGIYVVDWILWNIEGEQ